jgi:protein phosphatase
MHDHLLSYAMLSHPGRIRQRNEDACAADPACGVFVVCDGVGGAAGGEVASELGAKTFVARVKAALEAGSAVEHGILDGVEFANQAVHSQSQERAELYGMATTMVAMVFHPLGDPATGDAAAGKAAGTVWLANVGDSRCYRLRGDEFEQLTDDHSIVEEQVRSGAITREQAETSPIRNVITRAIGSEAGVKADVQSLEASKGDVYLLASDGLTREMAVSEVAAVLRAGAALIEGADAGALDSICEELIARANQRGGGDNITCLLVRVN